MGGWAVVGMGGLGVADGRLWQRRCGTLVWQAWPSRGVMGMTRLVIAGCMYDIWLMGCRLLDAVGVTECDVGMAY